MNNGPPVAQTSISTHLVDNSTGPMTLHQLPNHIMPLEPVLPDALAHGWSWDDLYFVWITRNEQVDHRWRWHFSSWSSHRTQWIQWSVLISLCYVMLEPGLIWPCPPPQLPLPPPFLWPSHPSLPPPHPSLPMPWAFTYNDVCNNQCWTQSPNTS